MMKSIASGKRSSTTTREFFLQETLTKEQRELSTAVMGIPLIDNRIVLCKNHRGWELPGGHIEPGETIMEALHRELHEEAGITDYKIVKLHGITHVTNHHTKINKTTGLPYPPKGYIPHFLIQTKNWTRYPVGEEVIEANIFDLDAIGCNDLYLQHIFKSIQKKLRIW